MNCWKWLFGKKAIDEVKNGDIPGNTSLRNAVDELLRVIGGEDGRGGEIGRLNSIANSRLLSRIKITKGIKDRVEKTKEGNEIKKLGKTAMLSEDWKNLNALAIRIRADTSAAKLVENLKEFLNIHLPALARDMHHKRRSIFDQTRNKLLFWGVFFIVGVFCFPSIFHWFGKTISGWAAGFIGMGIGQIVNFTSLGKYFGGQSTSQGKWEDLARHYTFLAPTDETDKVKQAIYHRMQETLPWFFLQSSGNRTTTAEHLREFVQAAKSASEAKVVDEAKGVFVSGDASQLSLHLESASDSHSVAMPDPTVFINRDIRTYEEDRSLRVGLGRR